jgi:peptide chain release factor 3
MKRKQFSKGMTQIAQEGAIRIFQDPGMGLERVIVGVVGVLQFDVLEFRMESEYGVRYIKRDLPHQLIRYIVGETNPSDLKLMQATRVVQDMQGRYLLIFTADYEIRWALEKNPSLELAEFHTM